MNKTEIIRKISKKAGVPDTEAKKFFEIFLKNASEILKPGESLEIAGVGTFQLRVGQIENHTSQNRDEEFIYSDLIVYINNDENFSGDEEIIFNVPSGIEKEYQPVDSYFSLSIGKPVIPLKGAKETEFFIPPSGTELRSLLESKLARLISEAEKTEGGKETETILLNPEENSVEHGDWDKPADEINQAETKVPDRSDFLKTREFENLSWDFGENLSGEIEEDSTPNLETDRAENIQDEPVQEEDSGPAEPERTAPEEAKPLFDEEEDVDDVSEDIFEEVIDEDDSVYFEAESEEHNDSISEKDEIKEEQESIEEDDLRTEGYDEQSEAEEEGDEGGDEENVKDLTEPEEAEENEREADKPEPEEPLLKNFQRVRSLTKEFRTTEFDDAEEIEEESPRRITEVRGGYQKVRRTTAEFNFDLSGIKGLDEIDEEPPARKKRGIRDYQGYRKRSGVPTLIIAFAVIIALAGIIFLYFKLKSAGTELPGQTAADKGRTTTIERDYDVPVTYPYSKSGENKTPDNGTVKDQPGKNETELKTAEIPMRLSLI